MNKVPTQYSLQKLPDFSFTLQKKTKFSPNSQEKVAKIKRCRHINPSETTVVAPSENVVYGCGYKMAWPCLPYLTSPIDNELVS